MTPSPPAAHTLDVRGQICPSTLLLGLREMNRLKGPLRRRELRLVVLTDHREATETLPQAARSMGYEAAVERAEGVFRITIQAPEEAP